MHICCIYLIIIYAIWQNFCPKWQSYLHAYIFNRATSPVICSLTTHLVFYILWCRSLCARVPCQHEKQQLGKRLYPECHFTTPVQKAPVPLWLLPDSSSRYLSTNFKSLLDYTYRKNASKCKIRCQKYYYHLHPMSKIYIFNVACF